MLTIDILIVTYNRPEYLQQLLLSINQQTILPKNVFIYDDCSSDEVRDYYKCLEYDNLDITWVLGETKSESVAASRNIIAKMSTSDIFIFSDDDDIFAAKRVETTLNLFNRFADVSFVLGSFYYFMRKKNQYFLKKVSNKSRFLNYRNFVGGNRFNFATFAVRNKTFQHVGGWDENLTVITDWVMYCRLSEVSNGYFSEEILSYYRLHENNLSSNWIKKMRDFDYVILSDKFKPYVYEAKMKAVNGKIDLRFMLNKRIGILDSLKVIILYFVGFCGDTRIRFLEYSKILPMDLSSCLEERQ